MAATGTVSITGTVEDLPTGNKTIGPLTQSLAAAVDSAVQLELSSGFNQIDVPTGTTLAIVIFASASTTNKTLKGVTGDTGIPVHDTGLLMFCPTGSSFGITAAADDTGNTTTVLFV